MDYLKGVNEATIPVQNFVDRLPLFLTNAHLDVTWIGTGHTHRFSSDPSQDDVQIFNDIKKLKNLGPFKVDFRGAFIFGPFNKGETDGPGRLRQYP
jgi:hypothetical protein